MVETRRSLPQLTAHLGTLIRQRLWLQVLVGMFLGVAVGILIGPTSGYVNAEISGLAGNWISLPGRLFLIAIQFVVVPLVVASVIRGIAAGEAGEGLGVLGSKTVIFFLTTTVLAVGIGILVATVIQPGKYLDGIAMQNAMQIEAAEAEALAGAAPVGAPKVHDIPDIIVGLFPKDPLSTFVSGNMLQIVIAAAIIGVALTMTPGDQRKPLLDLLASVQAACMVIVGWVMRFAPLAVFGLLAHITSRVGLSALIGTSVYVATVLVGLLLLLLSYLAIGWFVAGRTPRRFLGAAKDVMLLAFSTSSSASVMPLSLSTTEEKLGVRPTVARFVIPLGTTINMGGTALYQGVATLFLAQVFGIELGVSGILLVTAMATGAAIGSPGTPGVGIVVLATILTSVGIPPSGIAIILGVDRLLDMCRTVVNVTGDMVACITIDHLLLKSAGAEEPHLGKVPTPAMHAPEPPGTPIPSNASNPSKPG
jgi:Na+/H+-dicarboxylate symporter